MTYVSQTGVHVGQNRLLSHGHLDPGYLRKVPNRGKATQPRTHPHSSHYLGSVHGLFQLGSENQLKIKIDSCQKFWSEFVEPDFQDFRADQGNLRKAFHCAISLFHMSDWIYKAKGLAYWRSVPLVFVDRTGAQVLVHDGKSFANALVLIDPNFELVRNIANSAKHYSLSSPGSHPSSPGFAANTYSQPAAFSPAVFSPTAFAATERVMLEAPGGRDLIFLDLASTVRLMLMQFCASHGITL